MTQKTRTTWQGWILDEQPTHLRFATQIEAQAWMDKFLATDSRIWSPEDVRILSFTEVVRRPKTIRGWHPALNDADSTYWARRGYGDGDL